MATLLLNAQNGSGMPHCMAGRQFFSCMLSPSDISKWHVDIHRHIFVGVAIIILLMYDVHLPVPIKQPCLVNGN